MAITVNIEKNNYTDLDLNFIVHPVKKDINKLRDQFAVVQSVKNLLLTSHYERPFQPELGSNIRKLLFDQLDNITASNIDTEIRQVLSNYEPRVRILLLEVTPDSDINSFRVQLQFLILNSTEPVTINFLLERVR
jgi:phage baseplate assembly protein W